MGKIKILVSHRIDLNSHLINNPLYINVECGATFSNSKKENMIGDNTGDNISHKRIMYGELTVQYWAWKNVSADYLGLCHYRRYLSYGNNKKSRLDVFNSIREPSINERTISFHKLDDSYAMEKLIESVDIVYGKPGLVSNIQTEDGLPKNVKELWYAHDKLFIEQKYIEKMLSLIKENYPSYYASAEEYFSSDRHIGFNCYVMKREYFYRLCEFQFGILELMEDDIKEENYIGLHQRTPGYLAEIMYGIFVYHLVKQENVKYIELPIVFFQTTEPIKNKMDYYVRNIKSACKNIGAKWSLLLFPRGSQRRIYLKKILHIK